MKVNGFGKKLPLLAFVFGLVFSGCDFGSNDNQNENFDNGSGSGAGIPVLVEGEWTDGTISKDGQTNKYSIEVTEGTRYFIYLNDTNDGNETKTADIGLKIYHSDGTTISSNYWDVQECWEKPFTFRATSGGTVTITAASHRDYYGWEQGTGTYAIKYTSRSPECDVLSEGVWKDDRIIADKQTNKYSFEVTAKTRYFIYLNDKNDGNSTKTAERIGLKIYHSDGTVINKDYENAYELYEKPFSFVASSNGTVTITAANYHYYNWETGTGTYGIKYTSRPECSELPEGQWKNDEILVDGQTNKYVINVTAGTKYSIYLNDAYDGDGIKTAEKIGLKIYHSDDTVINRDYEKASGLYEKPFSFVASSNGTVTITAANYHYYAWENGTGTYAIKYTSSADSNFEESL